MGFIVAMLHFTSSAVLYWVYLAVSQMRFGWVGAVWGRSVPARYKARESTSPPHTPLRQSNVSQPTHYFQSYLARRSARRLHCNNYITCLPFRRTSLRLPETNKLHNEFSLANVKIVFNYFTELLCIKTIGLVLCLIKTFTIHFLHPFTACNNFVDL